jgi:hypothetical protein
MQLNTIISKRMAFEICLVIGGLLIDIVLQKAQHQRKRKFGQTIKVKKMI